MYRFVYVAVNERAKARPLFFWKAISKEHDASKCTCLAGDCGLSPIKIVPNLNRHKSDQQAKDDAKWR